MHESEFGSTVMAFVECTKLLLNNGVQFVLSHVFNQDPLEEHFGRHRSLGHRSENPSFWQFDYQENKIRLQRTLAFQITPKGNVRRKRTKRDIEKRKKVYHAIDFNEHTSTDTLPTH
jgi:hypothetical protein